MFDSILALLDRGLLNLPWWGIVLYTLGATHLTIASVTIYLHRSQAHRALDVHPALAHCFRAWLWLTTGMLTRTWVAIHRKHHAKCETEDDPHSPVTRGLKTVLLQGAELYRAEARNPETLQRFGHGTPDDWVERHVYTPHEVKGVSLLLIVNVLLFGVAGLIVWAIQMAWIPLMAAGVINGLGHAKGYRNFEALDTSTNIVPWGILIGGEELHNNHHTYPTSAKLSVRAFEFDLGWTYIQLLRRLGLVSRVREHPVILEADLKPVPDLATLQALITNRFQIMANYSRMLKLAYRRELERLGHNEPARKVLQAARRWVHREPAVLGLLSPDAKAKVEAACALSPDLRLHVRLRQELHALWEQTHVTREQLVHSLQDWCKRAEASGSEALRDFSLKLRRLA